jgi:hypothetical protein
MTTPIDLHLAAEGRGEPRQGLLDQAAVSLALAATYATQLATIGWIADDTADLSKKRDALIAAHEDHVVLADDAHHSVQTSSLSITYSKTFLRRLRLNLPFALAKTPEAGLTLADFQPGHTLGRNPTRIREHLVTIRPKLAKLDAVLTARFQGDPPTTIDDWCVTQIDHAQLDKHTKLGDLPASTLAVYATKGALLQRIKDLNSAGQTAFDGDAVTSAKFNRDVLLAARHERAKTTATTTSPPPPPVQPPPPTPPAT